MADLRPYQQEAVDAVFAAFKQYNSALMVLPTGTGKTVVFAKIAEQFRPQGRTLVLAHREELLTQAKEKIEHWTSLKCGIEQAEKTVSGMFLPDVTIASVQSLSRMSRLERFAPDSFGLITTDEAHHATAPTYQAIYRYFPGALHLGVTATADRADKKALGAVYETVAFSYDIRDAIENNYLVPIRQQAVYVDSLDLSRVRTTAGDLNEADLEEVLMQERNLHEVAQPTVDLAEQRPTLVFATTVKHARALADVINRYKKKSAESIDGSMDSETRGRILGDFRTGKCQFLVNCMIVTEGVDIQEISCVAMARPTKSRALYTQMAGRGTRLCPPDKRDLLILDFVGNSGKHSLICALDILDGNMDLEVRERAQTLCLRNPDLTVLEALEAAAEQLVEEKRAAILARARFQTVDVDPFVVLGVQPRAGRWSGKDITPEQIEKLERHKIPWKHLDAGQAEEVLRVIRKRVQDGICSVRQGRQLMRFGLSPDVSFEVAGKQMDTLASVGWRPTLAQLDTIKRLAA